MTKVPAATPPLTKYNEKKDYHETSNCYFNPNHETPLNLKSYISIVNKEITELLKKPNYQQPNLTAE